MLLRYFQHPLGGPFGTICISTDQYRAMTGLPSVPLQLALDCSVSLLCKPQCHIPDDSRSKAGKLTSSALFRHCSASWTQASTSARSESRATSSAARAATTVAIASCGGL